MTARLTAYRLALASAAILSLAGPFGIGHLAARMSVGEARSPVRVAAPSRGRELLKLLQADLARHQAVAIVGRAEFDPADP
jgi:hypothetical protein